MSLKSWICTSVPFVGSRAACTVVFGASDFVVLVNLSEVLVEVL